MHIAEAIFAGVVVNKHHRVFGAKAQIGKIFPAPWNLVGNNKEFRTVGNYLHMGNGFPVPAKIYPPMSVDSWRDRVPLDSVYQLGAIYRDDPRPIVIFGAGNTAEWALDSLSRCGLEPVCYCDNDTRKHGTEVCGLQVISPEALVKDHSHSYIVIASFEHARSIHGSLRQLGFPDDRLFIFLH